MNALLVIDMLNDFMTENGALYCGDDAKKIIPFIKDKIDECRLAKCKVIYVCDAHDPDDKEFKMFPPHAVKGTEGAEIIDELKPGPSDIVVDKATLEPFYGTDLDRVLRELKPDQIGIVGVCTSICVIEAVSALHVRGFKIVVYKDGVADFDAEAHEFALKKMADVYGAEVRD